MRVLLVEDDRMIGESIRAALKQDGSAVDWVRDGRSAESTLATEQFDLVLLDLGLPLRDGLEILRAMRLRHDQTPVIVLTARDALQDRVAGLGHPVACAAGGPPVRMGRCDREQCGVSLRPSAAPQAGQRLHSQRARRRLLRGPARGEPVKSIRTWLLVSLLSVVLLSAAASAALTYTSVLSEAEALFDYQLRQMALSLRDQG